MTTNKAQAEEIRKAEANEESGRFGEPPPAVSGGGELLPEGIAFRHNFAGDAKAIYRRVMLAKNGEHKNVADCIGDVITLVAWYVHRVETENDAGEIREAVRIVLFNDDGTTYSCMSQGIFDALEAAAAVFSAADWKQGIKLELVQKKTTKKRSFFTFLHAED